MPRHKHQKLVFDDIPHVTPSFPPSAPAGRGASPQLPLAPPAASVGAPSIPSTSSFLPPALLLLLLLTLWGFARYYRSRAGAFLRARCPPAWLPGGGGDGGGGAPAAAEALGGALRQRPGLFAAMLEWGAPFPALHSDERWVLGALRGVPARLCALLPLPPPPLAAAAGGDFPTFPGPGDALPAAREGEAFEGLLRAFEALQCAAQPAGGATRAAAEALVVGLRAAEAGAAAAAGRALCQQAEVESGAQRGALQGALAALRARLELLGLRGGRAHGALAAEEAALEEWARALAALEAVCGEAEALRARMRSPFAGEVRALKEDVALRVQALLTGVEPAALLIADAEGSAAPAFTPATPAADAVAPVMRVLLGEVTHEAAAAGRAEELRAAWAPLRERLARAKREEEAAHAATGQRRFANSLLRAAAQRAFQMQADSEAELGFREGVCRVQAQGEATLMGVARLVADAREAVSGLCAQLVVRGSGGGGGGGGGDGCSGGSGGGGGGAPLPARMQQALLATGGGGGGLAGRPLAAFDAWFSQQRDEQGRTTDAVLTQTAAVTAELRANAGAVFALRDSLLEDAQRARAEDAAVLERAARAALFSQMVVASLFLAALAAVGLGSRAALGWWVDIDTVAECWASAGAAVGEAAAAAAGSGGGWAGYFWWAGGAAANALQAPLRFLQPLLDRLSCWGVFAKVALLLFFLLWLLPKLAPLLSMMLQGPAQWAGLSVALVATLWFRAGRVALLWAVAPHFGVSLLVERLLPVPRAGPPPAPTGAAGGAAPLPPPPPLPPLRPLPHALKACWCLLAALLGAFAGASIATREPLVASLKLLLGLARMMAAAFIVR